MAEQPATAEGGAGWPKAWPVLAFLAFGVLCLVVYGNALRGEFVSDDVAYIQSHPYTERLDVETVRAVFDPFGPAKLYAANYAPVHLLLTAVERQMFADDTLGYHLVNVAVHAANATLLVALFLGSGIPAAAALLGGAIFALHPANVEAVAWVSQLKTNAALLFSLAALLAFRRHPGWATALFVLGLLTKASAAFALPTAAAFLWARGAGEPGPDRRRWAWLALWTLLFAAYAIPQFGSFADQGEVEVAAFEDRGTHLRTVAAVGARYLVMAVSSWGVSTFQEPEPASSWLDPWWLLALPAGVLLALRLVATLRARRVEAAWWVAAAASFAPVSQVFPFLTPVADRYLYFILPGLLGGALCAWTSSSVAQRQPLRLSAAAAAGVLTVFFGFHAAARADVWRSETWVLLDAAEHYPEGSTASFLRALRATQQGDVELAVAELRDATEDTYDYTILLNSSLATLRPDPGFQALLHDRAGRWIELARRRGVTTQPMLRKIAMAHLHRHELDEAVESYERALQAGGPLDAQVRKELEVVRDQRAKQRDERARTGAEEVGHPAPRP